jgi:hypothetical protein
VIYDNVSAKIQKIRNISMQSSLLAIVKDGKIQLPDSLSIPEGTKVLIVPLPLNKEIEQNLEGRNDWDYFALQNLNQCYGKDEPEYTTDLNQVD